MFPLLLLAGTMAGASPVVFENDHARLSLDLNGGVTLVGSQSGTNLLENTKPPGFMALQIGGKWHAATSLVEAVSDKERLLHVTFLDTPVTASAVVRVHRDYFEVEAVSLDGEGCAAVEQWAFVKLPVNLTANVGSWLNVAWDDAFAVGVIALEEKTDARGAPQLQAVAHRSLGFAGRKAAIVACPTPRMLPVIRDIEHTHGLPSPKLGGEWAKTSPEARKSWMITRLSVNGKEPTYSAESVFGIAKDLGVEYVVIGLGWNKSLGSYAVNTAAFPEGVDSLKAVADKAHALGLKVGLHVMTGSISKNDPLVTPVPDPRLCRDAEATLAAAVDATAKVIPTRESVAGFGTASGYWAYGGVDVQIDNEIIRYGGIADGALSLTDCLRGAYGTHVAPHKAGAKVRHITERYGWYVASPELGAEIGRKLADLINKAGLDMICFDGADVKADLATQFFRGHQVAQSLLQHARRDVLLISNGSTHFGWHCMARGGEDDAMARGYKRWVDDHTVHTWGVWHQRNFMMPDFSWVGIYPHTPTMAAARPEDVELVCARSLGYDAPIGWGFAACYGGPSNVDTFSHNGRHDEIASVIRHYEQLRLHHHFPTAELLPLRQQGSEWRLLPPDQSSPRHRLVPAAYAKSDIIRPDAPETAAWQLKNELGPQPLRIRIEALPALAPYGATNNLIVADFAKLPFAVSGNTGAKAALAVTGENHPQAGAVARLSCVGPTVISSFPYKLAGHSQSAWAQASAAFPTPLDLHLHRGIGVWIKGDGGHEVLNVRLELTPQSYLHFYQPIDFTGWKYCELGEMEGDRVLDYFSYEKYALHDVKLDRFAGVTLMILNPPRGNNVDLQLGRIEALREVGGQLVNPRITVGGGALTLPVTLEPEQYLETGDVWGTRDPAVCRVFNADGQELRRFKLGALPVVPAGAATIRFQNEAQTSARARVTLMLENQ